MYWGSGKIVLGMIQLGSFPMGSYPRVMDRVSEFKVRSNWAGQLNVAFDSVVFFSNAEFGEFNGILPIKVFKI